MMRTLKSLVPRGARENAQPSTSTPASTSREAAKRFPETVASPRKQASQHHEFKLKFPVIYLNKIDSLDPIPNNLTGRRMRQGIGSVMLTGRKNPAPTTARAVVDAGPETAADDEEDTQVVEEIETSRQGSQTTGGSQPQAEEEEKIKKRRRRRHRKLKYSRVQTTKKCPLLSLRLHEKQFEKILKEIRATERDNKLCSSLRIKNLEAIETKLSKKYYDVSGITVQDSDSSRSKYKQERLLDHMEKELGKLLQKISVKMTQLEIQRAQLQSTNEKRSAAASCCNYCATHRK